MKNKTVLISQLDTASFGFQKGYAQALSWVKEIGGLFDNPAALNAIDFVVSQLEEGRETVHAEFMKTLRVETISLDAETDKEQ